MASKYGPTVLAVEELHTQFFTPRGVLKAVNGVSFSLRQGEVLGLIGETGCGKSVTARSIMNRVPYPGKIVSGRVLFRGENLLDKSEPELRRIRGKDISIVPQNPHAALNPFVRVKDQIVNAYRAHLGGNRRENVELALEILARVGIPDPHRIGSGYPHELSGGMAQRVVIAEALVCSPRVLIADEPTTGLDVIIQRHVLELIARLVSEQGISMILITHDLGVVAQFCDTVAVMFAGQIVEYAGVGDLFQNPLHPYSVALIGATPDTRPPPFRVEASGQLPELYALPTGCYFEMRCPFAQSVCKQPTTLEEVLPGHHVRCHLVGEEGDVSAFASQRPG